MSTLRLRRLLSDGFVMRTYEMNTAIPLRSKNLTARLVLVASVATDTCMDAWHRLVRGIRDRHLVGPSLTRRGAVASLKRRRRGGGTGPLATDSWVTFLEARHRRRCNVGKPAPVRFSGWDASLVVVEQRRSPHQHHETKDRGGVGRTESVKKLHVTLPGSYCFFLTYDHGSES